MVQRNSVSSLSEINRPNVSTESEERNELEKLNNKYVQDVINDRLPLTIGGGIGQSRLCMFMLEKAHIGEVQASVWSDEDVELLNKYNIHLL